MKRLVVLFVVLCCVSVPSFSQKRGVGKVKTVVIDPGHGGAKPGAIGKRIQEKDLVLQIAMKFGKLIKDNYPDVNLIYTRSTDVDINLSERAHIANRAKADLFISIHANSYPNSTPTGVETYVMGLSQSKANMEVAKKENADILLESGYERNSDYKGFDPNSPESYVMFAMYQNAYLDKSLNFAQAIQNQYKENIKTINRGVKQAEIFVLYKTAMPAVLTEVGFISNPEEEDFMVSDEGQAKIVMSLFNAFVSYKSMEEGTKKPTNLKIDLPGYNKNAAAVQPSKPVVKEDHPVAEYKPINEEKKDAAQVTEAPKAGENPVLEVKQQDEKPADVEAKVVAEDHPAIANTEASAKEKPVEKPLPMQEPTQKSVQDRTNTQPTSEKAKTLDAEQKNERQGLANEEPVIYKVQFLSSDKELKEGSREFKGLPGIEFYMQNGVYRYTVGHETDVRDAVNIQKKVREAGFKDAFVVAFYKGQRITLQQAKEIREGK